MQLTAPLSPKDHRGQLSDPGGPSFETLLDGLVVRLTQAEEELFGLGSRGAFCGIADPVLSDDQAAVRACLARMLRIVEGVAA